MPPTANAARSGLFSGVFGFVSRELESFVTTATGGTLSQIDENPEDQHVETPHRLSSSRALTRKERSGGYKGTKRCERRGIFAEPDKSQQRNAKPKRRPQRRNEHECSSSPPKPLPSCSHTNTKRSLRYQSSENEGTSIPHDPLQFITKPP